MLGRTTLIFFYLIIPSQLFADSYWVKSHTGVQFWAKPYKPSNRTHLINFFEKIYVKKEQGNWLFMNQGIKEGWLPKSYIGTRVSKKKPGTVKFIKTHFRKIKRVKLDCSPELLNKLNRKTWHYVNLKNRKKWRYFQGWRIEIRKKYVEFEDLYESIFYEKFSIKRIGRNCFLVGQSKEFGKLKLRIKAINWLQFYKSPRKNLDNTNRIVNFIHRYANFYSYPDQVSDSALQDYLEK